MKTQKGTISKVSSADFQKLSKKDEAFLREQRQEIALDFKNHHEKYTRHTSDLIKRYRDIAERLILGGAEPGLTQKDTAGLVWRWLEEDNISYSRQAFYKCFLPEQKREWQSSKLVDTEDHKHEFIPIGHLEGVGDIEKCVGRFEHQCDMLRIDGRLRPVLADEPPEPELERKEPKIPLPKKFWKSIEIQQRSANLLYDYAGVLKQSIIDLSDEEFNEWKIADKIQEKCTDFIEMAINKKEMIDPLTLHLLVTAFANSSQKRAGGVFLKYKMNLGDRRNSEAITDFEDEEQLSRLLSTKQIGKAMRGKIRKLHERYEPWTKEEAKDMGFSGDICEECGRRRVDYENIPNPHWKEGDPAHEKTRRQLYCYACGAVQTKRRLAPLPNCKPVVYADLA